jgi:hypothetical protein
MAEDAKKKGSIESLPKLPITHHVLIRDPITGQLRVNDHDEELFERFGTHVYMQNKMDLHWAREHVRDVWADVIGRALAEQGEPVKWDLSKEDFVWKNRGMEIAVLDLYIQELEQRRNDLQAAIDENQIHIASLVDETQTIVDAAHIDEVIRNYEEEAASWAKLLIPINNAITIYSTQKEVYDPVNLALYQRYLLQLQREDQWDQLNNEYMDFQNFIQVHWHRLPHPVGGYAQLPRQGEDYLPIFGASQLPLLTTPENLADQLKQYLYKGKPFLLAYHDLSPGVISTMQPNFIQNSHGDWVVEIPLGYQFVNNELTLVSDRYRVRNDLFFTLQTLTKRHKIMSINEFRARGKIIMIRRRNQMNHWTKSKGISFAPQKRPPYFHEEHYDKSVRHEMMINAMDWYDTHYFTTLVHLELADSGKKYIVAPPGRPWGKVKERLRRYWRQNYVHFAWMYYKNYSLSRTPGEILFFLEEYYRLHNFDRQLFQGKPLHYKPILTDYDQYTLSGVQAQIEALEYTAELERQKKVEILKDQMMDEIVNFPDIIANNARPLYNTPLQPFESPDDKYVLPQGTMISLNPEIRKKERELYLLKKSLLKPFAQNLENQKLLIPERDFTTPKYSQGEKMRKDNFFQNLKDLHNVETPYNDYKLESRSTIDFVSAVHEPYQTESF